jgi:hypothetical protein
MNVAEKTIYLNVANDFSRTPGPRFHTEGKYSGEEFREKILKRLFQQAISDGATLHIDLDGGYGYATSFLEEAFGGLAREFPADQVLRTLSFKSEEEPYLVGDIQGFIRKADG